MRRSWKEKNEAHQRNVALAIGMLQWPGLAEPAPGTAITGVFERHTSSDVIETMKPLAIDLYCGLGGWTKGFLAEGYRVIGFDIERRTYPGELVIQDVLTLHGSAFRDATVIVASPPCQGYSYRAMPWRRARALPPPDNTLFKACFRIQREASEAAGRHIPLVVENVRGAQKWVGRAVWHYGSFYLWGDVPALMPIPGRVENGMKCVGGWFRPEGPREQMRRKFGRKTASAMVAEIPFPLARHIARIYRPK